MRVTDSRESGTAPTMSRWAERDARREDRAGSIEQRRVQRLHTHLMGVPRDAVVTPALLDPRRHARRLWEIGLPPGVGLQLSMLAAVVGPRSRFNATGDEPSSGRRFPRSRQSAPAVRLQVVNRSGAPWAVVAERQRRGADDELLLHSVNLFLELFGRCDVFWEPLAPSTADAQPVPGRAAAPV